MNNKSFIFCDDEIDKITNVKTYNPNCLCILADGGYKCIFEDFNFDAKIMSKENCQQVLEQCRIVT